MCRARTGGAGREEEGPGEKDPSWGGRRELQGHPLLCQQAQTAIYFHAVNKQFKYYPSSIISNMETRYPVVITNYLLGFLKF